MLVVIIGPDQAELDLSLKEKYEGDPDLFIYRINSKAEFQQMTKQVAQDFVNLSINEKETSRNKDLKIIVSAHGTPTGSICLGDSSEDVIGYVKDLVSGKAFFSSPIEIVKEISDEIKKLKNTLEINLVSDAKLQIDTSACYIGRNALTNDGKLISLPNKIAHSSGVTNENEFSETVLIFSGTQDPSPSAPVDAMILDRTEYLRQNPQASLKNYLFEIVKSPFTEKILINDGRAFKLSAPKIDDMTHLDEKSNPFSDESILDHIKSQRRDIANFLGENQDGLENDLKNLPKDFFDKYRIALAAILICKEEEKLDKEGKYRGDERLQFLVEKGGLNPDSVIENGMSLLMLSLPENINKAKILMDHGANLDLRSQESGSAKDQTLLEAFVEKNNLDTVKLLLKSGANPNAEGKREKTPLMTCCSNGKKSIEAVEFLLKEGKKSPKKLDVNHRRSRDGMTALEFAVQNKEAAKYLVPTLLKYGADQTIAVVLSGQERTPLMTCVIDNNFEIAKILLSDNKVDPQKQYENVKKSLEEANKVGKYLEKTNKGSNEEMKKLLGVAKQKLEEKLSKIKPPIIEEKKLESVPKDSFLKAQVTSKSSIQKPILGAQRVQGNSTEEQKSEEAPQPQNAIKALSAERLTELSRRQQSALQGQGVAPAPVHRDR